ncbi:MAG: hypothetical protein ACW9W3_07205 [Candidatus Nitrosopumilus sp. bin_68KS]
MASLIDGQISMMFLFSAVNSLEFAFIVFNVCFAASIDAIATLF